MAGITGGTVANGYNGTVTVVSPSSSAFSYAVLTDPGSATLNSATVTYYTVTVKRDVPQYSFYAIALGALLLPAILLTWRSLSFEHLRWAESDHPPINLGGNE